MIHLNLAFLKMKNANKYTKINNDKKILNKNCRFLSRALQNPPSESTIIF